MCLILPVRPDEGLGSATKAGTDDKESSCFNVAVSENTNKRNQICFCFSFYLKKLLPHPAHTIYHLAEKRSPETKLFVYTSISSRCCHILACAHYTVKVPLIFKMQWS